MKIWLEVGSRIDRFSDWMGRLISWLALAMVFIGAFNAIARYYSRYFEVDLSSNAFIELQWYMFSALFLLGVAYTLRHDAHVRVDVAYSRLSPRARAWLNLIGTIIFLFPFSVLMIWVSWPSAWNSWSIKEMSPDPGGLPRYPIKALIPFAFVLLLIQGVSELVRHIAVLRGDLSEEEELPDKSDIL